MSSVEAWFATALDIIEEDLSSADGDQLHVMVVDVMKSFDTMDRSILDRALWVVSVCPLGLGRFTSRFTSLFTLRFG